MLHRLETKKKSLTEEGKAEVIPRKRHTDPAQRIVCGQRHADANLQESGDPMPYPLQGRHSCRVYWEDHY